LFSVPRQNASNPPENRDIGRFYSGLSSLKIIPQKTAISKMMLFHDLLVDANSKVNLTKVLDWPEVVLRHYLDSLSVVMAVPSLFDGRESILDIGSGFGMPGIPLKVMFPGNYLVMLDSVKKKIDFIDFAVNEMNLTNVDTIVGRAEDIAKNRKHREKYSVVVSRAVASLPVLLELALPFCSVGGTFIAMKSSRVQPEIDRSETALNLLGGQIDSVVNVGDKLPLLPGKLVVIRKIAETPDIYPRKAGIPKKRPL
jgi:16S rRNA (guanine527-N7)-methyltransferase